VPQDQRKVFAKELESGKRVFVLTFAIGHFVCQVLGSDFENQVQATVSDPGVACKIFPPTDPSVTWPPVVTVDGIGGVDAFANAFNASPI